MLKKKKEIGGSSTHESPQSRNNYEENFASNHFIDGKLRFGQPLINDLVRSSWQAGGWGGGTKVNFTIK